MDETTQHVVTATAAVGKWGGFTVAGIGALSLNEQLAVIGFIVGVIGTVVNLLVNAYYKHKTFKVTAVRNEELKRHEAITLQMAKEAHAARMAGLLE